MHRFYADDQGIQNGFVRLCEEDARHAVRVLRMKEGEGAEVFSDGKRYATQIDSMDEGEVICRILDELSSTEARLRITLYQGLPKADKMELITQKAVELGADTVVPVAMSRCVVQLDQKDGRKKQERWQKIAREACKQSGRCQMLTVETPITMKELLTRLPQHETAIVPWEDAEGYSLRTFQQQHPLAKDVAIVIGPEGGMSPEEVSAMQDAGCRSVTLGPRILRTETAGLCAISALMCLYGDME